MIGQRQDMGGLNPWPILRRDVWVRSQSRFERVLWLSQGIHAVSQRIWTMMSPSVSILRAVEITTFFWPSICISNVSSDFAPVILSSLASEVHPKRFGGYCCRRFPLFRTTLINPCSHLIYETFPAVAVCLDQRAFFLYKVCCWDSWRCVDLGMSHFSEWHIAVDLQAVPAIFAFSRRAGRPTGEM